MAGGTMIITCQNPNCGQEKRVKSFQQCCSVGCANEKRRLDIEAEVAAGKRRPPRKRGRPRKSDYQRDDTLLYKEFDRLINQVWR